YRRAVRCEGDNPHDQPGVCPVCGMHLTLISGRNYAVSVAPPEGMEIEAGKETTLRFRITAPDGSPVTKLEVVHEKILHLLMVSKDLSWFAHEHPVLGDDGTFTLRFTFPRGGIYVLYHDF